MGQIQQMSYSLTALDWTNQKHFLVVEILSSKFGERAHHNRLFCRKKCEQVTKNDCAHARIFNIIHHETIPFPPKVYLDNSFMFSLQKDLPNIDATSCHFKIRIFVLYIWS